MPCKMNAKVYQQKARYCHSNVFELLSSKVRLIGKPAISNERPFDRSIDLLCRTETRKNNRV